ncbi:unnamed protein product [Bursaphelenchus xylophilus]|uniref:(pine wood nematode) hypothetical protein n=1 Tax=Bursaphelenchus xylophilus TaxID=6326 RepID=A0A1I7SFI8_BURXY|nr:unnamed protein product [Bursaphelenchus xylophilus]CAG9079099.1 unnamed protein product [Bursaphelenchus xylophilus]
MPELITRREPPFFYITLNRPAKKNAINDELYDALPKLLRQINSDDEIIFTVLTGAGDFFSAGTELTAKQVRNVSDATPKYIETASELIEHKKIAIALLNGPAIGIAATILGLFDLVLATEKAYFLLPFTQLGLLAEGTSSTNWVHTMGRIKAAKHLIFSEKLSAKEAHEAGLISHVYPEANFKEECEKYLKYLTTLAPGSVLAVKELMVRDLRPQWRNTHVEEVKALIQRAKDPEMAEFMAKSIQKRKAKI